MKMLESWFEGAWRMTGRINLEIDCKREGLETGDILARLERGEIVVIDSVQYRYCVTLERKQGESDKALVIRALQTYGPRTAEWIAYLTGLPMKRVKDLIVEHDEIFVIGVSQGRWAGNKRKVYDTYT